MQDILPIRPYKLLMPVVVQESAIDGFDGSIELLGSETLLDEIIVIAGLVTDVLGPSIDATGSEPRFLVSAAPVKEPRSFVLMTEREIRETFQPCELPDEPSQPTTDD